ncbi:MAG TPA: cytochrome C, partial [Bradyrhizobium sp.]|nr:cytochrome C [Bradyrhizobium sp.]
AAAAQGRACAAAIVNSLAGKAPDTPRLDGACYNTVAPGYAFSLKGIYQPKDDQYAEAEVTTSPVEAPRELRQHEADQAVDWFKAITGEAFG